MSFAFLFSPALRTVHFATHLRLRPEYCSTRRCETINNLLTRIGRHYVYQASQALLRIAGDLDILGSPVALLGNLGSGVRDFFYEPANALLYSPRELHLAVAKGTMSLMRNTVFSTVNATSKVSGTLGKGLAALSMDDAFVRRRAARMAAQRPKSIAQGLRHGARNLGEAVAEGAAGLITSPLDGARRDGVKGAIVGVAQGVVGVALKPATGVFDLAAKSTESMRNASGRPAGGARYAGDEATGRARARPPRALGPDATLQALQSPSICQPLASIQLCMPVHFLRCGSSALSYAEPYGSNKHFADAGV